MLSLVKSAPWLFSSVVNIGRKLRYPLYLSTVHLVVATILMVGLVTVNICRYQTWFSSINCSRADSHVKMWRNSSFTNRKLDCFHHLCKSLQLQLYLAVLSLSQRDCALKYCSREVKICNSHNHAKVNNMAAVSHAVQTLASPVLSSIFCGTDNINYILTCIFETSTSHEFHWSFIPVTSTTSCSLTVYVKGNPITLYQ